MLTQMRQEGAQTGSTWLAQSYADISGQDIWFNQRRVRNFKNNLCQNLNKEECLKYENLELNMLDISPDDMPVVGNLVRHPNVFVNGGHGARASTLAFISAAILNDQIEGKE